MKNLDLSNREKIICLALSLSVRFDRLSPLLDYIALDKILNLNEKEMRRLGLLKKEKKFETIDELKEKKDNVLQKCREENIAVLTILDDNYPKPLKNIYNPPLVLFYKGILPDYSFEEKVFLAFIGSRKSDEDMNLLAQKIAYDFSIRGGHVVSGLAHGIDAYSHQGACLAKSPTTAIVANGLDIFYPFSNRLLCRNILDCGGVVMSEYAPGEEPLPYRFHLRNRIIAGLSEGIFVVQSPRKSGTKITVNHGLENGRDIYAYANFDRDRVQEKTLGNEDLLESGAVPIYGRKDFFKKIKPNKNLTKPTKPNQFNLISKALLDGRENQIENNIKNPLQRNLLSLIRSKPQSINELSLALKIQSEKLNREVLELKLEGLVKELPNKKYFVNQ